MNLYSESVRSTRARETPRARCALSFFRPPQPVARSAPLGLACPLLTNVKMAKRDDGRPSGQLVSQPSD